MIFGDFHLSNNAIHTHNDSYVLSNITTVSARRPFLGASFMLAALLAFFCLAFLDLFYLSELLVIASIICAVLFSGFTLGQLQLLSRDLKGSELSTAIWGSYQHLNDICREIADAINGNTAPAKNLEMNQAIGTQGDL